MADDLLHEATGIDSVFSRFNEAFGRVAFLEPIADELRNRAGGANVADRGAIILALQRMVAEKKLLPSVNGQFNVIDAENVIATALAAAGAPQLALTSKLSAGAMKLINNVFDRCGANNVSNPPPGPPVGFNNNNGRRVVVYFIEEDPDRTPLLPRINGKRTIARSMLRLGFENWEGVLNLDVAQTFDRNGANLIVTGKTFGREVPDAVLALTDIGPPNGTQLRMVFDLAEEAMTATQFKACAAHEFGHALGIYHADVQGSGHLMSPILSEIFEPDTVDMSAAERRGWQVT